MASVTTVERDGARRAEQRPLHSFALSSSNGASHTNQAASNKSAYNPKTTFCSKARNIKGLTQYFIIFISLLNVLQAHNLIGNQRSSISTPNFAMASE
jgi:hypothetical protein